MERKIKKSILFILLLVVIILIIFTLTFINKNKDNNKEQRKEVLMINLVDKSLSDAIEYFNQNEIEYEIVEKNSNKYEKDIIISQSINESEIVNSKVIVTVSLGPVDKKVYSDNNVNELGRVPVMMYHGIHNKKNSDTKYTGGNVDRDGYQRTSEAFINDLEFYYQNGYRMIRLNDYINGKIDVELGKSPIILTFDDGLKNNINVTGLDENGNIIIDPNSAVGILESFKKKYPDYNVTATFFVNNGLFEQEEYNEKILKWLVDNGYDIGNHTLSHVDFTTVDSNRTVKEVGGLYKKLNDIIGDKFVNIVALPFGSPYKKSNSNFNHILSGDYEGFKYETLATLRVGWESDYSPFSSSFDKTFIKRIRAYDNNGVEFDIEMNFKNLKNNRYISDGDITTIVVKESDREKIKDSYNLDIITY